MSNKLKTIILAARKSNWGLKKFNIIMKRVIPFNKSHGISVEVIESERVSVIIPYKRKNLNHIKGIHACGLATAGEYCAGLLLLSNLPSDNYRLIMKSLHAEYLYQAKKDVTATFKLSEEELKQKIIEPLNKTGVIMYTCVSNLVDTDNNDIATITTEWQIKSWDKVKMKL